MMSGEQPMHTLYHTPSFSRLSLFAVLMFGAIAIAAFNGPVRAEGEAALPLRMTTTLAAVDADAAAKPRSVSAGRASLTQLVERALAAQPVMLGADALARANSERLEQARGALRPSTGGVLGYNREFADSGGTTPFTVLSGGLRLTIPLYRPQADASINQAQFQESSSRSAYAEVKQDVLFRTVDAFLGAAQAEETASLLGQERDVLLAQRNLNQRRMEGGVGTIVDVMETSARAETILSQIETTRATYRAQLAELGRLAWTTVEAVPRLSDGLPSMVVPATAGDAVVLALGRNSTLARLDAGLAAARAGIGVQRATLSPTVDLVGGLDRSHLAAGGTTGTIPSTTVGVQLAIPFSTGGVGEARIREASALADSAQAQLDDATRVLETEMQKGYVDLQRAMEQWRIQVSVLATATASLAATRKAFDAGARTNIDLLNSQQLTFATRRELLTARVGVLEAQLRILTLIGDLNTDSLARIETAFESPASPAENAAFGNAP